MILDNGIPRFAVEIQESLKFTAYHKGVLCTVTTLSRINTRKITCWSSLEEAVRFLKNVDDTKHQKKNVIHEHLHVVGLPDGDDNSLFRVLCYFKSTLLSSLQRLPIASVRTLTRITSKFSSFTDTQFISKFFGKLPKLKRKCVILIDEVYVKAGLRHHGGSIFGKAANDPTQLARTVLCIMWLRVSLEARASSLRWSPSESWTLIFSTRSSNS